MKETMEQLLARQKAERKAQDSHNACKDHREFSLFHPNHTPLLGSIFFFTRELQELSDNRQFLQNPGDCAADGHADNAIEHGQRKHMDGSAKPCFHLFE